MVATWGWRVATISGVQLPWNVDQAVSETHELSAGQCRSVRWGRASEGTALAGRDAPTPTPTPTNTQSPAAPPQAPTRPWGEHEELPIWETHVHWHSSKVKTSRGKIWGRELSTDTEVKMSWGKICGRDLSLMTQFKSRSEFSYWHFTGSQRASDSHAAPAMARTAPWAAPCTCCQTFKSTHGTLEKR